MSFAAIAIGVGAAATAASTAFAASQTPDAPDYKAATREGVMADVETLPVKKLIESAARLGKSVEYVDPSTGERKVADFRGFGDVDQARSQLAFTEESADVLAKLNLDLQEKYGAQYIEQQLKALEQSDPTGFALRKQLGERAASELSRGYELDPSLKNEVIQAERAGQAARGNILGQSSAAAEAMEVGNAAFRMYQQRLANASAFLSGTTPVAQFSQVAGAQQGAVPVNAVGVQQGVGLSTNAGAQSAAFAQQNYQNQVQNNPWLNFAGQVSGMGQTAVGSGLSMAYLNSLMNKQGG